jgi:hypothetical protein
VRGNGKIIQELEANFRGNGWNVIKVIWGGRWDPLLAKDKEGILRKRMEEAVDGEYQAYQVRGGAYTREHFFGKYPELSEMVATMSDEDIWRLNRGGHDPHKVYAAYAAAMEHRGQPTVILAKTVKGYGTGEAGEGQNVTHQMHDMAESALRAFRDRFNIPISDEEIGKAPFYLPAKDSPELQYMHERRRELGGYLPVRKTDAPPLEVPELAAFDALLEGTAEREMSTTMAAVRVLQILTRDKAIGKHVVPIVPDESRTFGMEGMFRRLGIYSSVGQLYDPVDSDQVAYYREEKDGQILQEGINEAGAMASFIAAGTSYASHAVHMVPFYIFYSMFGFQRIGDLAWAAGDMQCRGFLLGGTSGRTTLAGEGLQHQDGHSHILAGTIPSCISYDPAYAYELAVIIQDGLRRMYREGENVYYYLTVMNEKYAQPAMPKGGRERDPARPVSRARRAGEGPARPAARQRRDPARGPGGGRDARARPRRLRRRLERDELQRARPGRSGGLALECAASDRRAAPQLRRAPAREHDGAGRRGDGLRAALLRADPRLRPAQLSDARHRRLGPQRQPREAAPLLRGPPQLRLRRGPVGPRGRWLFRPGEGGPSHREIRHRCRATGPEPALTGGGEPTWPSDAKFGYPTSVISTRSRSSRSSSSRAIASRSTIRSSASRAKRRRWRSRRPRPGCCSSCP